MKKILATCLILITIGSFAADKATVEKQIDNRKPSSSTGDFICGSGYLSRLRGGPEEEVAERMNLFCDKSKPFSTNSFRVNDSSGAQPTVVTFCCIAK